MSLGKLGILAPSEEDVKRLLAAKVHIGTSNCTHAMSDYVAARTQEGGYILDLEKFWDKMVLAARVIVAIDDPNDVCVISARDFGKRAAIKFAQYTKASQLPDRFTPGTFTNQIQDRVFMEPRLLILTDPQTDHQSLKESSYVNIPVIALCNTDSCLQYVDIAIPCNNRNRSSLALVYWLLARTVRRMRGLLGATEEWDVAIDLFYHRDPEEIKDLQEEEAAQEVVEDQWGVEEQGADPQLMTQAQMQHGMGAAADGTGVVDPNVAPGPDWADGAGADNTPWDEMDELTNWNQGAETAGAGGETQNLQQGMGAQPQGMGQQGMGQQQYMDPSQGYNQPMTTYAAPQQPVHLPEVGAHQAFPEVDTEQW